MAGLRIPKHKRALYKFADGEADLRIPVPRNCWRDNSATTRRVISGPCPLILGTYTAYRQTERPIYVYLFLVTAGETTQRPHEG
ncbi:hypothetical protein J6590_011234 [Homalodisca vitripennis]|nr:hypothetical protein J6590_011234 [Homalodisca vitripennis]